MICHKCHKYGHTKTVEDTWQELTTEVEIEERAIKKMQDDSRVRRRRAFQILAAEDESARSKTQSYPTHFRCKMDPEKKRKFNPWAIEKSFTQEIGSKPDTIRPNESEFVIKISYEK